MFLYSGCIYSHMKEKRKIIIFKWLTLVLASLRPNGWRTQRPFDSVALITAPRAFCFCCTKIFISPYASTSHSNATAFRSAPVQDRNPAELPAMLPVIPAHSHAPGGHQRRAPAKEGDNSNEMETSALLWMCLQVH